MKKVLLFCLLVLSFGEAAAQAHSFRGTDWLMSKAQVIASEKRKPDESRGNTFLYKNIKVANMEAVLLYKFNKSGGLIEASYLYNEAHSDDSGYYNDYQRVVRVLNTKYGEGEAKEDWRNELFKDKPMDYGRAAAAGHVLFLTTWEKGNTIINAVFAGDNFKISHGTIYKYRFESKEEQEEPDLKDF